ncbi:MAG TPA: ATP-dependent helicase, partial [Cellulomonas sp.]
MSPADPALPPSSADGTTGDGSGTRTTEGRSSGAPDERTPAGRSTRAGGRRRRGSRGRPRGSGPVPGVADAQAGQPGPTDVSGRPERVPDAEPRSRPRPSAGVDRPRQSAPQDRAEARTGAHRHGDRPARARAAGGGGGRTRRLAALADVRRAVDLPPIVYPEQLPVSARRSEISAAIAGHQVVIVAGETGSGKTTQIPKIALELGRGREGQIGHTQPRRIAARTVAERIAEELGTSIGELVGYQVRFTDESSDRTLVKVMTDGILLAQIQRDPELRAYDT